MSSKRQLDGAKRIVVKVGTSTLEIRMTKKGADRVYHVVEKMPEYPGGMKAFFNYIRRNPKRMQREVKKQMLEIGIGTKSQQALKLQ